MTSQRFFDVEVTIVPKGPTATNFPLEDEVEEDVVVVLSEVVVGKKEKKFNGRWTKQIGTSSGDNGYGVTTDSSGNIYVTGYTEGGLDGNTNSGGRDIFLVKFNSSGIRQ